MRSIGNDIKSTNVNSSSSITQTHIDEAGSASDSRAAALIASQATYELGLRVTAKTAADLELSTAIAELNTYQNNARIADLTGTVTMITAARNAAIAAAVESETTARNTAINTAIASETTAINTAIKADGYFDKIITSTAEISQAGWDNTDTNGTMAVFSHKNKATTTNYGFMQHSSGTTYINSGDHVLNDGLGQINVRINDANITTFTGSLITFLIATSGPSDRRFKKNITVPSPSKNWTDFKLIGIKQYNKVYPNINSDKLRLGVIAQELEAIDNPICKNAVKEITLEKPTDPVELAIYNQGKIFTDASGEERSGGFKSVEYEQLYRMNLIITQQLMARVEALELALSKKS